MKIKFLVSQITTFEPPVINGLILLKLKDKKYQVLDVTNKSVRFDDNPWTWGWNFQQIGRLDGGTFKTTVSDKGILVNLHFYLNLLPALIGMSIPVIGTVIEGLYEGTIFFIVFIITALFFQAITSKNAAKGLLKEILSDDVLNNDALN
jgi:hypothetical protein